MLNSKFDIESGQGVYLNLQKRVLSTSQFEWLKHGMLPNNVYQALPDIGRAVFGSLKYP